MRTFFKAKTAEKLYTALETKALKQNNAKEHPPIRYPDTLIRLLTAQNTSLNERIIDEKIWDQTQRVGHPDKVELKIQMGEVNDGVVIAPLSDVFKEELRNFTF